LNLNQHYKISAEKLRVKNPRIRTINLQNPRRIIESSAYKHISLKHLSSFQLALNNKDNDQVSTFTKFLSRVLSSKFSKLGVNLTMCICPKVIHLLSKYRPLRTLLKLNISLSSINQSAVLFQGLAKNLKIANKLTSVVFNIGGSNVIHQYFGRMMKSFKRNQRVSKFCFSASFSYIESKDLIFISKNLNKAAPKLKVLSLNLATNGVIDDEGLLNLQDLTGKTKSLEALNLNILGAYVTDKGVSSFLKSLSKNFGLAYFRFHTKNLERTDLIIDEFFKQHMNLKKVNLSLINSRKLDFQQLKNIQTSVASLKSLRSFILDLYESDKIGENGIPFVIGSLKSMPNLVELQLFFGEIKDVEIMKAINKSLYASLGVLKNLESFAIDFGVHPCLKLDIENAGDQMFLEQISHLKKLKNLSLGLKSGLFDVVCFRKFCHVIQNLETINFLEIDLGACTGLSQDQVAQLIFSAVYPPKLDHLILLANGINYQKTELSFDLREAFSDAKQIKEAYFSFRKMGSEAEAGVIMKDLEKRFPHCIITLKGSPTWLR